MKNENTERKYYSDKGLGNAVFSIFSGFAFGAFFLWVAFLLFDDHPLAGMLAGICGLWGVFLAFSGIGRIAKGQIRETTRQVTYVRTPNRSGKPSGQAVRPVVVERPKKRGSSLWTIVVTIIMVVIGYQIALFGGAFVGVIFGPVIGGAIDKRLARK